MKKLLFLLVLVYVEKSLHAQQHPLIYTIRADSVKITNSCDTAELIIENHTQNIRGFLFNKGRGRTEFRRAVKLNDSTLILGGDTITIVGGIAANNGLSKTGNNIQLGQAIGAAGNPAALTNNREIPLNNFGIQLTGGIGSQTSFLKFSRPNTTTHTLQEMTTSQGNTFGNYFLTLDETTLNPDGQRDAVLHLGYNITGAGGRRNLTEGSFHDSWESHYDPGTGVPQFERFIQFSLPSGQITRPYSIDMRKTAPLYALTHWRSDGFTTSSTDGTKVISTYGALGDFNLYGDATHAAWQLNNRNDGTYFVIQTEAANAFMRTNGVAIEAQSRFDFVKDQNAQSVVMQLRNNSAGANAQVVQEFVTASTPNHCQIGVIGPNHPTVPNFWFFNNPNTNGTTTFTVNGNRAVSMNQNGKVAIGFDGPTALLHIKAGSASANTAPIKLTSSAGALLTTPEDGAIEYDGNHFYSTVGINRYQLDQQSGNGSARKSTTVTGSNYTIPANIDVVFVNYTGGQATITLPTGSLDREITIKNLNTSNTVILSGLDTNESNSIATRGAITVKYTGSSWVGISKF